jgi:DNA polymerase-3 subunit epsilon
MRAARGVRGAGALAYRSARPPAGRTRWREAGYCAVDLELTGLDPTRDEVISFGAVPIDDGRVQLGTAVRGLVRPEGPIGEAAIRVHGLRAADLAEAPPLDRAIDPLLAAMAGRIPVFHVAAVERAFLGPALRRQGLRLRGPDIDTSVLSLSWNTAGDRPAGWHVSLGELARALHLPVHDPHDALGDALTTAQVFLALATHLDARLPATVRSLTAASRRPHPILSRLSG